MGKNNTFLSCRQDGFVDMWEMDDSSGRQKFRLVDVLINFKDTQPPMTVRVESSDKGFDQEAICLMDAAHSSKWCVKFVEN